MLRLTLIAILIAATMATADPLPTDTPQTGGMSPVQLKKIDGAIANGIQRGNLPGAVVLVLRQGKIVFRKAYGSKSLEPKRQPMTLDTVFDLASLTKPIATASSIMKLIEEGKIRLRDRVTRYLPAFGQNGKSQITILQLLTHTAGLIADNPIRDYADGKAKAIERIYRLKPIVPPGSKFIYTDVGFIVLGLIVENVSGMSLNDFAAKHIFEPLRMASTRFNPKGKLADRAAPTEKVNEEWLQGTVHDPRSRLMGGVAGHAGLFSTANDLARYAQMMLQNGTLHEKRIFSPATVQLMTKARAVPRGKRALGWDIDTRFSSNRGELFPVGSYGHTGFTGTSIWLDPTSQTAVIFLSHRVHPHGKGGVVRLRGQVSTIVASSIVKPPLPGAPIQPTREMATVLNGIDVLKQSDFKALQGKKVALVTNHTGIDRQGNSTIDLLHQAKDVDLKVLFSPEHGIRGKLDQAVADDKDQKTGLPIYSLYGKRKRPTLEQLQGIDTIVFDIQDIGCRFYTYISTLGYILEEAARHKKKVIVLDRPNPIGGVIVSGPVLDSDRESFTGYHPIPVRHGMTIGELATMFNRERKIGADLGIIKMRNWKRDLLFDQTGLLWVNPSPNMRSLTEAILYPGIGLLETTNLSVGRGTDRPFEIIGAPWLDGQKMATELAKSHLPGIRFVPTRFTPVSSVHKGKECGGLHLLIDNWQTFQSIRTGMTIAATFKKLYPGQWQSSKYLRLLGNARIHKALEEGSSVKSMQSLWKERLQEFKKIRERFLLYQ